MFYLARVHVFSAALLSLLVYVLLLLSLYGRLVVLYPHTHALNIIMCCTLNYEVISVSADSAGRKLICIPVTCTCECAIGH